MDEPQIRLTPGHFVADAPDRQTIKDLTPDEVDHLIQLAVLKTMIAVYTRARQLATWQDQVSRNLLGAIKTAAEIELDTLTRHPRRI